MRCLSLVFFFLLVYVFFKGQDLYPDSSNNTILIFNPLELSEEAHAELLSQVYKQASSNDQLKLFTDVIGEETPSSIVKDKYFYYSSNPVLNL